MTRRDRIVVGVIALAAVLAGFWFLVLAPRREEAGRLSDQIAEQQERLTAAQARAQAAETAKARYEADYAAVAKLGQAVPADDDVPSLVYQLDTAADRTRIDFRSLKLSSNSGNGGTGGGAAASGPAAPGAGAPATAAAAAQLPPGASVGPAGFPTMPFSFVFDGSFFDMQRFLDRVTAFTRVRANDVRVRGRLLTIDEISLAAGRKGFPQVSATVQATAYVLPAGESVTNGATPAGPRLVSERTAPAGAGGAGAGSPAGAPAATAATPLSAGGSK